MASDELFWRKMILSIILGCPGRKGKSSKDLNEMLTLEVGVKAKSYLG